MTKFHTESIYEGKEKSCRPNLRETRDKWPLDRDLDMSWCHRHTMGMIKLYGHNNIQRPHITWHHHTKIKSLP